MKVQRAIELVELLTPGFVNDLFCNTSHVCAHLCDVSGYDTWYTNALDRRVSVTAPAKCNAVSRIYASATVINARLASDTELGAVRYLGFHT